MVQAEDGVGAGVLPDHRTGGSKTVLSRRGLLGGLGALLAAPAIVRVQSLMPLSFQPLRLLGSVGPIMAAKEALQHQREALNRMWQDVADLIMDPPFPTAREVMLRRQEALLSIDAQRREVEQAFRSRTMIGQPAPTPSESPA